MEAALSIVNHKELQIHRIQNVSDALFRFGTIDVFDMGLIDAAQLQRGQVSAECGDASFRYVTKVIELAMEGKIDATVTNAFNKEAVNLAGHHYSGHTEIYADLTGTKNYTMMLAHENLRVVHVSTHVSLREACDRVKKQRVLDVIRIADQACRDLGIEKPRIGVAGLNPHSGEHGLFGREEIDEIIPAIEAAQAEGICADGPVPPDTVFSKARGGLVRYRCRHVSRSGTYSLKGRRLCLRPRQKSLGRRSRSQYHTGSAHYPGIRRSRHSLRSGRNRNRQ